MNKNYYHVKENVDEYIKLAKNANGALLIEKMRNFLRQGSLFLTILLYLAA